MKKLMIMLGIALASSASHAQLLNGGFETGSGSSATSWTKYGAANRETWAAHSGSYGMSFEEWNGATGGFYQDVAASAGNTFTLSAWFNDDTNTVTVSVYSMNLEWLDNTTNVISVASTNVSPLLSNVWQQFSLVAVSPVGTVMVRAVFQASGMTNGGDGANETLKIDDVTLTVSGAPVITNQPTSQTVFAGANATFTVGVSNTAGASYQWQFNSVNLTNGGSVSGATTPTLTITGVSVSDVGNYRVVVTNSVGTTISSTASLGIYSPVLVNGGFEAGSGGVADNWTKYGAVNREGWANRSSSQGMAFEWWVGASGGFYQDVAVNAGDVVAFGAWFNDDQPAVANTDYSMKLEWFDSTLTNIINTDSNYISGVLNNVWQQLGMTNTAPVGAVLVRVVFEADGMEDLGVGANEVLKIDDVTLEVIGAPVITNQPTSQTVFAGANATFTVGVSNTAGASYQWQLNSVNLTNGGSVSGATSPALTITGVSASDVGDYRAVVTNASGTAISSIAHLGIYSPVLVNGGFEAGSGGIADNWTKYDAANREGWANHSGGQGMALEWWVGASGGFYQDVLANAGDTATLSAWFSDDAAAVFSSVYSMKLEWLDSTLNVISVASNNVSSSVSTNWQQLSLVAVAPVGTVLVRVVFEGEGMVSGETLKIDDVTLALPGAPVITNQPVHRAVSAGANATYTVGVSNLTGATFQWQLNNVNLVNGGSVSGATSQTLAITGVASGNVGHYRVQVSNGFGTTTSSDGTLQIVGISKSGANAVVSIQGKLGDTNVVEYANALTPATWIPLSTNVLASSPELVTDPSPLGAIRFYRAVYQP